MPSGDKNLESTPSSKRMIFRFSAYGFLKNQQYYEPFLILAFREKGLSFFEIGVLIAFREICINLMEVPSGAVADVFGRRRSMILSFIAYVVSFVIFGFGQQYWHFYPAMLLFAVGEAFRTGTHKAMIFDWLRQQGREDEKTRVYGYTRSWSKLGSALSALIAAALVLSTGSYSYIFWISIPPYLLNIINFLGYPKSLDGEQKESASLRRIVGLLYTAAVQMVKVSALRGLVVESMMFEGTFKATKDYIQPLIKQVAVSLPFFLFISEQKRTAILVGMVFFVLFFGSSAASRNAYRVSEKYGGEDPAARLMWIVILFGYGVLGVTLWLGLVEATILAFVLLYMVQNVWRPVLISRFNVHAQADKTATILSIESQAKTLSTMAIAPFLGWAVDRAGFWPVGVCGVIASLFGLSAFQLSRTKAAVFKADL